MIYRSQRPNQPETTFYARRPLNTPATAKNDSYYQDIAAEYVAEANKNKRVVVLCSSHDIADQITAALRSLLLRTGILLPNKSDLIVSETVCVGSQITEALNTLCVDRLIYAGITDSAETVPENLNDSLRIFLSFKLVQR